MKSLTLFLALTAIGFNSFAQGETPVKEENVQTKTMKEAPAQAREKKTPPPNEYVKMTDGKLWHYVDGKQTEMTKEMVVTLGETKVKADGTVTMADGTTAKLKEGNIVNINGKVIDVEAFRKKAMEQKAAKEKAAPAKTNDSE